MKKSIKWQEATRLKKAWVLSAIWLGLEVSPIDRSIPDYRRWTNRELDQEIADLESDFKNTSAWILEFNNHKNCHALSEWMAKQYDIWTTIGAGILTLCTVLDFEHKFGPLKVRVEIETPPYAEILMQGTHSAAIRHPEYMLARDLYFGYQLFQQSEDILSKVNWNSPPKWASSEHSQALGRFVIQTCFNLLESFTSGLAQTNLLTSSSLTEDERTKLKNSTSSLRKRVIDVPKLISGTVPPFNLNEAPFSTIFDDIKKRRDSFVHCEPGSEPSKYGYVKESILHDITTQLVEDSVNSTTELIRLIWKWVYDVEGPKWLRDFNSDCDTSIGYRLVPNE